MQDAFSVARVAEESVRYLLVRLSGIILECRAAAKTRLDRLAGLEVSPAEGSCFVSSEFGGIADGASDLPSRQ